MLYTTMNAFAHMQALYIKTCGLSIDFSIIFEKLQLFQKNLQKPLDKHKKPVYNTEHKGKGVFEGLGFSALPPFSF